ESCAHSADIRAMTLSPSRNSRSLSASSVTTVVMSRSMSWKNCQAPVDCSSATLSGMALPYDEALGGVPRVADCLEPVTDDVGLLSERGRCVPVVRLGYVSADAQRPLRHR